MGHPGGGHGVPRPGEKAEDFKGTVRKLLSYIGRFKVQLIIVMVFALGSTVFNIVGPKVLSQATTVLFNGATAKIAGTGSIDFGLIGKILIGTLALYIASSLCNFVQGWLMSSISQKTCYRMRNDIAAKFDRMTFAELDKRPIGDTLSRITNDVDTLGQAMNQGITTLITSVVTVIGVIVMMLSINWIMTLIALVMIPLSAFLMMLIVKRSQKYFLAQQELLGEIDTQVEETFSGHAVVKAFGREEQTRETFAAANDRLCEAAWKSQFISGLMRPIMDFVGNLGYVAVAITGAFFAAANIITVGDIQAFIQYVKNFTQPIGQLAQVSNILQQMAAAAERIFAFLEAPEISEEHPSAVTADVKSHIVFDHVRFGYDAEKPVIHDFSAEVSPAQTVAIVGPTGAGKTTIIKLLMRFYDVNGGAITIGGHDVREFTRRDERSLFAMVLQDSWLFNGTIMENIRYGRLDATDEEVVEAAKAVRAHHFIQTLPGGYDFVINEDTSNISAGQRQILTIARAFLADRRILILDEATSSVDTRTERQIQAAMDALMADRTSFVIAHRLSTIRSADLILVMDHGDIVEQGTHDELLAAGGFYAELYQSQFDVEEE